VKELDEECDHGDQNGKDGQCSLVCKIVKKVDPLCGNGKIDPGETCETCPEDMETACIVEQNCTTCPCQFADIEGDVTANDRIRAKLRDASRNVFYKYSSEVFVSNFTFL